MRIEENMLSHTHTQSFMRERGGQQLLENKALSFSCESGSLESGLCCRRIFRFQAICCDLLQWDSFYSLLLQGIDPFFISLFSSDFMRTCYSKKEMLIVIQLDIRSPILCILSAIRIAYSVISVRY